LKEISTKKTGFLTFFGVAGLGKTYASVAALSEYLKIGGRDGRYYSMPTLYSDWLIKKKEGMDLGLMFELQNKEFLILDDIAFRSLTDAWAEFIYTIIDKRFTKKKATIFTCNLDDMNDFQKALGQSICSRIFSGPAFKFKKALDRRNYNYAENLIRQVK